MGTKQGDATMSDILDRMKTPDAIRKEELPAVLRALLARVEALEAAAEASGKAMFAATEAFDVALDKMQAALTAIASAMAAKSADYHVLRGTVSYEPKA